MLDPQPASFGALILGESFWRLDPPAACPGALIFSRLILRADPQAGDLDPESPFSPESLWAQSVNSRLPQGALAAAERDALHPLYLSI